MPSTRPTSDPAERFMRLFNESRRRIYGFILSQVPHEADADDLLQETNTVMWRKFDGYDPGSDFAAWGIAIARYEVMKHRTRFARERLVFDDATATAVADEFHAMADEMDRRREALGDCLSKLPERDRKMVGMRYCDGGTTRSVAGAFGVTVFTIYKTLNRIQRNLLECISRSVEDEEAAR